MGDTSLEAAWSDDETPDSWGWPPRVASRPLQAPPKEAVDEPEEGKPEPATAPPAVASP